MVGQHPLGGYHLYIVYSVVVQHFSGDIRSGHPVPERNFRIFAELALQNALDDEPEHHNADKENPIHNPYLLLIYIINSC